MSRHAERDKQNAKYRAHVRHRTESAIDPIYSDLIDTRSGRMSLRGIRIFSKTIVLTAELLNQVSENSAMHALPLASLTLTWRLP